MDNEKERKILEEIGKLPKATTTKDPTRAVSVTIPESLIKIINTYKDARGYASFSYTVRSILEEYFNNLAE